MSNLLDNEFTIYFRPTDSKPFVVKKCAVWLVSIGRFSKVEHAMLYLINLELHNELMFKHIMSEYHHVHKHITGYLTQKNNDNAFRSSSGAYGDEPHMYYSSTK